KVGFTCGFVFFLPIFIYFTPFQLILSDKVTIAFCCFQSYNYNIMTLRIATWNIFFGNDLATILHTIKTHEDFKNLDIFAIQEASIHDGVEDAKRIAAAFGAQYDYYQVTSHMYKGIVQANAIVW